MLYSTKQVENGIIDIIQVDLDQYAKNVNVPTNDTFNLLTTAVANKLDIQPMHTHYISQVEDLKQEFSSINNTIRNNKLDADDVLKNQYDTTNGNKFTTKDDGTRGNNDEIKHRLIAVEQEVDNKSDSSFGPPYPNMINITLIYLSTETVKITLQFMDETFIQILPISDTSVGLQQCYDGFNIETLMQIISTKQQTLLG